MHGAEEVCGQGVDANARTAHTWARPCVMRPICAIAWKLPMSLRFRSQGDGAGPGRRTECDIQRTILTLKSPITEFVGDQSCCHPDAGLCVGGQESVVFRSFRARHYVAPQGFPLWLSECGVWRQPYAKGGPTFEKTGME